MILFIITILNEKHLGAKPRVHADTYRLLFTGWGAVSTEVLAVHRSDGWLCSTLVARWGDSGYFGQVCVFRFADIWCFFSMNMFESHLIHPT